MVLSGFYMVVYSWASIVFSSGDVLRVYSPRETGTFFFPAWILVEIICDGIIDCRQTAFDVAAFHIKDGIFFIIFPIPLVGMSQEGM